MNLFGRPQQALLPVGQAFRLRGVGSLGTVGVCLGSGGQGAVYLCDVGGRRLALKWYWPATVAADAGLSDRIDHLTGRDPPDRRFVWPVDRAEIEGHPGFGYVMPLISPDRAPLARLFASGPERLAMPLAVRAFCCFDIADSFLSLHAHGLSYQDINLGAFFIDPLRGDVLVCDLDNVAPDGQQGGVYGTRRFEPPEVVLRTALPSARTDLFAMAVLFFMILFDWHPLEGIRASDPAGATPERDLQTYGSAPLFMFDPTDDANRPPPEVEPRLHARWIGLPQSVRDLFLRSFTTGLADPGLRVVETEWCAAMAALRDAVVSCSACDYELPLAPGLPDAQPICPACTKPIARPSRLSLPHALVGLAPAASLYKHHLDHQTPPNFAQAIGTVVRHPGDASVLGLRNMSGQAWTARTGADAVAVAEGQTVRVSDKLDIDFGPTLGRIAEGDHPAT